MNRDVVLLQALRAKLAQWVDYIKRASYATDVHIIQEANGEFSIYAKWTDKGLGDVEFTKTFTREYVFGPSMRGNYNTWAVQKCAGDYAKSVIRDILTARGF